MGAAARAIGGAIAAKILGDNPAPPEDGQDTPRTAGKEGEPGKPEVNLGDTKTWPTPPGDDGPYIEGKPSRVKPASRGEKSLYDAKGGEWRLHLPDNYHDAGHWDYKPSGNNQQWREVELNGKPNK